MWSADRPCGVLKIRNYTISTQTFEIDDFPIDVEILKICVLIERIVDGVVVYTMIWLAICPSEMNLFITWVSELWEQMYWIKEIERMKEALEWKTRSRIHSGNSRNLKKSQKILKNLWPHRKIPQRKQLRVSLRSFQPATAFWRHYKLTYFWASSYSKNGSTDHLLC
jgi:hypothetical protein